MHGCWINSTSNVSLKLPNETGGVLIGAFDLQRRRTYVILSLTIPT